ncbi:MAG: CAP domain-containing protein [bacterium]|nr:CAP domain-containing protein [bacterium]
MVPTFKHIFSQLKPVFLPCRANNFTPIFLQRRFLIYYGLTFIVLQMIVFPFYYLFPKTLFFADIVSSALLQLTNQDRRAIGISPLKENPILVQAAFAKAQDMLSKGYFSHTSPAGVTPWYWLKIRGYSYRAAGENLAIGFVESEEVQNAWENSPSHMQNLLNPKYQEIGIAVVRGNFNGKSTTIVVQYFGAPVASKATVSPPVPVKSPSPSQAPIVKVSPAATPAKTPSTVLGQQENAVTPTPLFETESLQKLSLSEKILVFGTTGYDQLASKVITFAIIILIVSLLISFSISWYSGRRNFEPALHAALFVILLLVSEFVDKQLIISLIPHQLMIY